jgi:hypothetical protein
MDRKNLMILFGIGLILGFLGLYYVFKSPIYLFNITLGFLALVYGFYTEGDEIKVSLSYSVASFSVNIIQWLIVIYIFYYSPIHRNEQFYMALIVAILTTLFLVNRLRKKYLKNHENTEANLLKDTKKLTLLVTSVIIMISSLTGFIAYNAFTLFYVATLGLTAFVYGYYHENGKLNISVKYVEIMAATILLQWIVLSVFFHQMLTEISPYDFTFLLTLSMLIGCSFIGQFIKSNVTLSDLILD